MQIQKIVQLLDEEILRLQQVRSLLVEVVPAKKVERTKNTPKKAPVAAKTPGKRVMSQEGRARIAAAQKARWAAQKKSQGTARKSAK